MKKYVKDWTVFIYADGNNELEPEMWQSKIDLEKIGSDANVNVIMQVGRESRKLVKIIRYRENLPKCGEIWDGVRRYYILKEGSRLINDLGKVNMADPHILYNFIVWGIKDYPAKKYMLILSGHGGSFIAALPDFSQHKPYAMGVPEMCRVINMIKEDTGCNIEALVLDICHMNFIEILYELGRKKDNTVKNVPTYINNGPLEGVPYSIVIDTIEKNYLCDTDFIFKKIIDKLQLNLIGIKLNSTKLKSAKKIVSDMAYIYLTDEKYKNMKACDFTNYYDSSSILDNYFLKLNKKLNSMIIHYNTIGYNSTGLINLANLNMYKVFDEKYLSMYYKLSFAKNNYWIYILGNKKINHTFEVNASKSLAPLTLQKKGIKNLIGVINPRLNNEEVEVILDNLYKYKKW